MINLLPPKEKEIISKQKQLNQVLIFGFLFLFCISFLGANLWWIKRNLNKKLLKRKQAFYKQEQVFELSEVKELEDQTKIANKAILNLNSFLERQFYISDILSKISLVMPPGTYLRNISYSALDNSISISGFCPDRKKLSELKQNLENNQAFGNIYFPASNWAQSENIDFFIKFDINYD